MQCGRCVVRIVGLTAVENAIILAAAARIRMLLSSHTWSARLLLVRRKVENLCTGGPTKLDAAAVQTSVLRQTEAGDSVSALLVLPCATRRRA